MAERRMFAKSITESDAFMEMPHGAQVLYFHLGMNADDEGFVNRVQTIMRMVRSGEDDLKVLAVKRFVILFETKVLVIKHWRINNYLRNDRFRPTEYTEERAMLSVKENGAYAFLDASADDKIGGQNDGGIPVVYQRYTQDSIGKDSIGCSINERECAPVHTTTTTPVCAPTIEEIRDYAAEQGIVTDIDGFVAYNEMRGWTVPNWKGALKRWAMKDADKTTTTTAPPPQRSPSTIIPKESSDEFYRAEAFAALRGNPEYRALDTAYRRLQLDLAKAEMNKEDTAALIREIAEIKHKRTDMATALGYDIKVLWGDEQ